MAVNKVFSGHTYRHDSNGNRYTILAIALDHETSKPVVVYFPLEEPDRSSLGNIKIWVRPFEDFCGKFSEA
jgi:hypothetical protein